jgi:hypothetical protein
LAGVNGMDGTGRISYRVSMVTALTGLGFK